MDDNLLVMYEYQIHERIRETVALDDKIVKLKKQIEILELTKKMRFYELDILKEQKISYEENYL